MKLFWNSNFVLTPVLSLLGNLETNLVGNSNVTGLFSGFNKISNFLDRDLARINQSIALHKDIISQLTSSITNVHQSLDYFITEQNILVPYKSTAIDVATYQNKIWLVAGSYSDINGQSCSNTTVYTKSGTGNFTEHSNVRNQLFVFLSFIVILSEHITSSISPHLRRRDFFEVVTSSSISVNYFRSSAMALQTSNFYNQVIFYIYPHPQANEMADASQTYQQMNNTARCTRIVLQVISFSAQLRS